MSAQHPQASRISTRQHRRLVLLAVLLMVAFGLVVGGDYGASIDEPKHASYGRQILDIYRGQRAIDDTSVDPLEHGPFYSFFSYYAGEWVDTLRSGWTPTDGRHFIFYLSFITATIFIGLLTRRYARAAVAWLVAGLFFSQPLLLGHAFINPKDVPFMAFFLGSLTLGVLAVPRAANGHSTAPPPDSHQDRHLASSALGTRRRLLLFGWTFLTITGLGALWLWTGLLPFLQSILAAAYRGEAPWLIQTLFHIFATDAYKTPLDLYEVKLQTAFTWTRGGVTFVLIFGALFGWASAAWPKVRPFVLANQDHLLVAGAGVMMGLDTSIRSIAPWAALVLGVLYLRFAPSKWKAILYILILTATSVTACLATWPFLWQDTFQHYFQSVVTLSEFPWHGIMLFNGHILSEGQQPWYYIPELMLLQFTLPVIALALVGVAGAWRWLGASQARFEVAGLLLTFAIPVAASFRPGMIVYNNFRQFLFTIPAFFLLAALALEQLFRWLPDRRWRLFGAVFTLLPGVMGIIRLHPYEYIYYNALAGLGGDVYARFESDYWCTSYREATTWLNDHAPQGATVEVGNAGIIDQATAFARSDLHLIRMTSVGEDQTPDFALICDGKGGQLNLLPEAPVLMTVERGGVVLGEVKDLRTQP
jgi:hypothetical protein